GREPRAERRHAGDVVALRAVRLAATKDHVLDFLGIEAWGLPERVLDAVGGEVVRAGHVERAADRLGERRARAGDDDGFPHEWLLSEAVNDPVRLGGKYTRSREAQRCRDGHSAHATESAEGDRNL